MNAIVEILRDKLKGFKVEDEPFNLLNLLFQKVNRISCDQSGKRREERLHSEMLYALLNSKNNGDVGSILTGALLDELAIKVKPGTEFAVELESPIEGDGGNNRPIDILLLWKDDAGKKHAIIIENKIAGAQDQDNQLNDYYSGLRKNRFSVDKIVYITLYSDEKTPKDAKPWVRKKIKVFSARYEVPRWLNRGLAQLNNSRLRKKNAKLIVGIKQYKDFIECLLSNSLKLMKAKEILRELTPTQVRAMLKLIYSEEWIEARFENITKRLKASFKGELDVECQKHNSQKSEGGVPVFTAQYRFGSRDRWIEVWLHEECLELYVCSKEKIMPLKIAGSACSYSGKDRAGSSGRSYHYYSQESWFDFKHPEKASGVNEILIKKAVSILEDLKVDTSKKRKRRC